MQDLTEYEKRNLPFYKKQQLALQEELLELRHSLKHNNHKINYFGKVSEECYMEVLLLASLNVSKEDVKNYKSYEYPYAMVEEVIDNVIAYMTETLKSHSELTYFLNELNRINGGK